MVDLVSLRDCPPGLFRFGETIGFKTEYRGMETVGPIEVPGDQVRWIVGNHSDAYVVESGESFWGGAPSRDGRDALMVEPVAVSSLPCKSGEGAEAWTDAQLKDVVSELLSHRGERPERILRGGSALWETWLPAVRAALRYLPAALTPDPLADAGKPIDATQTREAETREGCTGTMDAERATYFLERFKREEKLLGPHEQWALDFTIAALNARGGA